MARAPGRVPDDHHRSVVYGGVFARHPILEDIDGGLISPELVSCGSVDNLPSKSSSMIEASGKTSDGKTVVRGVYKFYETQGTPLDVLFETLRNQGCVPDWGIFVLDAVEAGMKPERVISMLDSAIVDSFGSAMRDVVVVRLRSMIETDEGSPPPAPTMALKLLAHEYDAIYGRLAKIGEPSYVQVMAIIADVLGTYVVQRMQGEVVGFEIVEELPTDRFVKL